MDWNSATSRYYRTKKWKIFICYFLSSPQVSLMWQKCEVKGEKPFGRSHHTFTAHSDKVNSWTFYSPVTNQCAFTSTVFENRKPWLQRFRADIHLLLDPLPVKPTHHFRSVGMDGIHFLLFPVIADAPTTTSSSYHSELLLSNLSHLQHFRMDGL